MINGFLYEYCKIIRNTITTNANSEQVRTENIVYDNIKCYVRQSSANVRPGLSNSEQDTQKVYISIDRGYTLEIGDIVETNGQRYIIEAFKEYNLVSCGNIRITCKRI